MRPVTFKTYDLQAIPAIRLPIAGERVTTRSKIRVPDNFLVQNLTLTINLTFP